MCLQLGSLVAQLCFNEMQHEPCRPSAGWSLLAHVPQAASPILLVSCRQGEKVAHQMQTTGGMTMSFAISNRGHSFDLLACEDHDPLTGSSTMLLQEENLQHA